MYIVILLVVVSTIMIHQSNALAHILKNKSRFRSIMKSNISSSSSSSSRNGSSSTCNSDIAGARGLSSTVGHAFSFLCPKLSIGRGIAKNAILSSIASIGAKNPYVITGKSGAIRHEDLLKAIMHDIDTSRIYAVGNEPTVEDAIAATEIAMQLGCDVIIAIGGGSAMDLGKVVAALYTNRDDVYDYIEVIGKGKSITNKPLPFIAVPTTSGTGSECTKNAVLKSIKHGRKASIRHDSMLPMVAIVDPLLTVSCPPAVTAHVGLDTLCQLVEPYTSNAANPIVDALAKEGIVRACRSLRAVYRNGDDVEGREDLAIASVLGGVCLANSKLGVVHGFASVLGGMFEAAPHGAICACLLPHAIKMNINVLSEIGNDKEAIERLGRFRDVAIIVTGNPNATSHDLVKWVQELVDDLQVSSIMTLCHGITLDHLDDIVKGTMEASSTKGNPVVLTYSQVETIFKNAI